jgi:predicted RNase H-like HicB family nuclease
MSTTITEVIEAGGYDLSTLEDARWLISQAATFDELVDQAEELIEESEQDND